MARKISQLKMARKTDDNFEFNLSAFDINTK